MNLVSAKHRGGFTLVEILLALMVVSIGVLTVVGLLGSALDTSNKASEDIEVVAFADLVLHHLSAEPFSAIPVEGAWSVPGYDQEPLALRVGAAEPSRLEIPLPASHLTRSRGFSEYRVSYRLAASRENRVKFYTLEVWPGFDASAPPRVFHTRVYDWSAGP